MGEERSVYILLTDTGTLLTRLIKWYTGDSMNHASLSFDSSFTEVYSFGRKAPGNPFVGGFVKEDLQGKLFGEAACALYRCKVSGRIYEEMSRHVQHMACLRNRYKYNLLGLFCLMFNTRLERRNAYFCSQFVVSVFEKGGMVIVGKPSYLVTPGDLAASPALQLVYYGNVRGLLSSNIPA